MFAVVQFQFNHVLLSDHERRLELLKSCWLTQVQFEYQPWSQFKSRSKPRSFSCRVCVYMSLCHWCGFSTPEQAQGFSHRKVSAVLLPQHYHPPLAFCQCACMHVCVQVYKSRDSQTSRLCTFMHAWVSTCWHCCTCSQKDTPPHSLGEILVSTVKLLFLF